MTRPGGDSSNWDNDGVDGGSEIENSGGSFGDGNFGPWRNRGSTPGNCCHPRGICLKKVFPFKIYPYDDEQKTNHVDFLLHQGGKIAMLTSQRIVYKRRYKVAYPYLPFVNLHKRTKKYIIKTMYLALAAKICMCTGIIPSEGLRVSRRDAVARELAVTAAEEEFLISLLLEPLAPKGVVVELEEWCMDEFDSSL